MNKQELTYWVTLALMPKIWIRRKNEIYVNCFNHNPQISIIDLFENSSIWKSVGITSEEAEFFLKARTQLANHSSIVEDMLSQGYDIIPIVSQEYPKLLKTNLGKGAPTVIFTKGNKQLLQAPSIGIVGSRKAENISLEFTDNIAKKATKTQHVIVSGFAKGIDKQALDSALEAGGSSIIVLPQGIMTFTSGFKQYYKPIAQGRLLVMSCFAPTAPWGKEFAMARNPIIYGMSSEIYVAQTDEKGGTWSGVIDGLRKNRRIYVRWPEANEINANIQLVQKGAIAVNMQGNTIELSPEETKSEKEKEAERLQKRIISILAESEFISSQELLSKLQLNWSDAKMKKHLDSMKEVEKHKIKNRWTYCLKGKLSIDLFSNQS